MMGLGGSGNRDDREEDDEEDSSISPSQETLVNDSGDEATDENDDSDGSAAAGVAGTAAGGAAGGSGGAAAGAGAGAAVAGGGAGTDDSSGSGEESEDSSDKDNSNDADQSNEESTDESEDDSYERDFDESDECEESKEEVDDEDDDEDDDDEDEEDKEAELVVHTDAWDTTGWGIEPTLKRLDVDFGDNFEISYEVLSPRKIDREGYTPDAGRYEMPYTDIEEFPDDTVTSTKALHIAKDLNPDLFRNYLRRLRIAALVEERSIEEEATLVDLAEKVGFESERFEKAMRKTADRETKPITETPVMNGSVGDEEMLWTGNLEYGFAFGVLIDNDVVPEGFPPTPAQFVSQYGPTPTVEATTALNIEEDQLTQSDEIRQTRFGHADFWTFDGDPSGLD